MGRACQSARQTSPRALMTPRRMIPLALLIVLTVVAWRLVRGIHSSPSVAEPAPPSAAARPPAAPMASPPLLAATAPSAAAAPGAAAAAAAPASRPQPVATPSSAPLPPRAGGAPGTPAGAAPGTAPAERQDNQLRDRTGGWGQAIIRQLNQELMPLASECIDQAVARRPKLEGTLALDLVVAPVDAKRALVESVTPSPYNQIKDDELVECIRQSSFAMEGLAAPYNFTLSMPIKPAG